jgi:hypothetical protein
VHGRRNGFGIELIKAPGVGLGEGGRPLVRLAQLALDSRGAVAVNEGIEIPFRFEKFWILEVLRDRGQLMLLRPGRGLCGELS